MNQFYRNILEKICQLWFQTASYALQSTVTYNTNWLGIYWKSKRSLTGPLLNHNNTEYRRGWLALSQKGIYIPLNQEDDWYVFSSWACICSSLNWSFSNSCMCFCLRPGSDKFTSFNVNLIIVLSCPATPVQPDQSSQTSLHAQYITAVEWQQLIRKKNLRRQIFMQEIVRNLQRDRVTVMKNLHPKQNCVIENPFHFFFYSVTRLNSDLAHVKSKLPFHS